MRLTAPDLEQYGLIDGIVAEPAGGAQEGPDLAADNLRSALDRHLEKLSRFTARELVDDRYAKFRRMGNFFL